MKDTCILRTDRLTVGYDNVALIRDIEIQIRKGQILTLIGPNGSGKSTILKSIMHYLKPLCGAVYIEDISIRKMQGNALAKKMAVVLTDKIQPELLTCYDIVATGRYPYTGRFGILSDIDKEKVESAMQMVSIWDLGHRDFTKISDGQKQRVLLARAICQEPEVIVLDEPTSYLDIQHKLQLLHTLRKLVKEYGIAVMMSMHEIDLAQKISDYVICVKGESIEHYGTPAEIFKPELIRDLYDLSNGSYNTLFGSIEMEKAKGEASIFVIAGGGSGIQAFRLLQRNDLCFFTGVLHENDIDYQVASALAERVIVEQAFSPISEAHYKEALDLMKTCDAVICCLSQFGEINQLNKTLLSEAKRLGLSIFENADQLITLYTSPARGGSTHSHKGGK